MALSPSTITTIDSKLEATCRKIWKLPKGFPRAGLHAPQDELGLNLPTIWEDYCAAAINSWTHTLNDQGALGATARASLIQSATKLKNWPLELAFHAQKGGIPLCPSIIARNIATLIAADLHPLGGPEIWSGNPISTALSEPYRSQPMKTAAQPPTNPTQEQTEFFVSSPPYGSTTSTHGHK